MKNRFKTTFQPTILEFAVASALFALVFVLWFLLTDREAQTLQSKVNLEVGNFASQIEADLRSRLPALQRFSPGNLEAETTAYLDDVSGFQALEWIDLDGIVREVAPLKGNESDVGLDQTLESSRRVAFDRAAKTLLPSLTQPLPLVQGGKGTLLYLPKTQANKLQGFVLAVFRFDTWLDSVFTGRSTVPFTDDFRISVSYEGLPFYESKGFLELADQKLEGKAHVNLLNQTWELTLRPTKVFVSSNQTLIPAAVTFAGALVSLLLVFVVRLFRRAAEKDHLEFEPRVQERTAELSEALEVVQLTKGALVQQEKMASLGRLAAGIAHEINNPTGYILSNMATLGEYFDYLSKVSRAAVNLQSALEADPLAITQAVRLLQEVRSQDDLDYILKDTTQLLSDSNKGATRIRDIVQGLRSFAHVENAEPVMSDLNEIVQESLKIVNNKLKYHCTLDVQLGALRPILAQSGRLEQVVINLLTNAADAIPTKGTIQVKTWAEPGSVCLSVTDDGQGMPPELVKRVFEPFFTTKDVGKGTGLGLSISMGIIEDHHGTINLSSAVGRGTTFTVKLPS